MDEELDFGARFRRAFQPVFMWGFGALILMLTAWSFYVEISTGTGPSLLTVVLPTAVVMAICWAIVSVLIALLRLAITARQAA